MKKIFAALALMSISCSIFAAEPASVSFLSKATPIITAGDQQLYLYEGVDPRSKNKMPCWTILQTESSSKGLKLIGTSNPFFNYLQKSLREQDLRFSFKAKSKNQYQLKVSQESYKSDFNLDSDSGQLTSFTFSTHIPILRTLLYGLNSETHYEYHNVTCADLKNTSNMEQISEKSRVLIMSDLNEVISDSK